ncbi:MAG: protease HtpX, partial [Bdellovibrionales bacterium RIFOXYB2_FULL_36_6]
MNFNSFKTVIFLGLLTGILLGIGYLFGPYGLIIGFIFALLMNFVSYFYSDKIVLWMYKAKLAEKSKYPELHELVSEIAKLANIPKPKVYIVTSANPNAFATGRNPKHAAVAVTTGIMELLDKEELKGVIAHEISHVKNRDILVATIAATIAGVISFVGAMARWSTILGGGDDDNGGGLLGLLVLGIITPIM